MLRNYTYLNTGLAIMYNGRRILSRHGLEDLLKDRMTNDPLYPIIHLKGEDIEVAFTHSNQYGEEYYSFVNGQHTTQGGTHQSAFKEHIAKTIKEFFGKYEYGDIRTGIVAAIAINVEEPVFESQTKIKLGSTQMAPDGDTINKYVGDFIKQQVDNYLHIHQRNWLVSVPRRRTCTIESCVTVASTSPMSRTTERKNRVSSSQRVTRPVALSPRAVM